MNVISPKQESQIKRIFGTINQKLQDFDEDVNVDVDVLLDFALCT